VVADADEDSGVEDEVPGTEEESILLVAVGA